MLFKKGRKLVAKKSKTYFFRVLEKQSQSFERKSIVQGQKQEFETITLQDLDLQSCQFSLAIEQQVRGNESRLLKPSRWIVEMEEVEKEEEKEEEEEKVNGEENERGGNYFFAA